MIRFVRTLLALLPPLLAAAGGFSAAQETRDSGLVEKVEVARLLVEARVLDAQGRAVEGLGPADFRVFVDGEPADLISAEWTTGALEEGEALAARVVDPAKPGAPVAAPAPAAGRLIVLFFQRRISIARDAGPLRMTHYAARFVEQLEPNDLVALVSHDSRLNVHFDFTKDHAAIARELRERILSFDRPPDFPAPQAEPSLAAHLDARAAAESATPEAALEALAKGLAGVPGSKTMVFLGWGLGRQTADGVTTNGEFTAARRALIRSRTTVTALDITDTDWQSLEAPMRSMAADTGGAFAKTNDFPLAAVRRAAATISGHYLLQIRKPARPRGSHSLEVALVKPRGRTVLTRGFYED